ncbi:MAG: hypothetical protein ACXQS8_07260, partial [Candidatus Helarchaeales archaeon]
MIIYEAGNGTWTITCNSTNHVLNSTVKKGSSPVQSVSVTDVVWVEAEFRSFLTNGQVNLTIYPQDKANFSDSKSITGNASAKLDNWDINETITDNVGNFTIQVFWFNGTEVGLNETTLEIISLLSNITYLGHNEIINAGDYVYVYFNYTDNSTGNSIPGSEIVETTLKNGTDGSKWPKTFLLSYYSNGTYRIRLSTVGLEVAVYHNVTIIIRGRIHQSASLYNITFILSGGTANISIINGLIQEYGHYILQPEPCVNATATFKIYYYNETQGGLENARIEVSEWSGGEISSTDLGLGNYTIYVSTDGLHANNNYSLEITVQKIGYDPISLNIIVPVKEIQTRIDVPPDYDNLQKYKTEEFDLIIHYYDTFHEISIPDAIPEKGGNVTCQLLNKSITMQRIISTAGFYKATIRLAEINGIQENQEYNITVEAVAVDFQIARVNISIYIKAKLNVSVTLLDVPDQVLAGKDFTIRANLSLTNGTPIGNVPVKFLITNYPGESIIEQVELTDENGIARTTISTFAGLDKISIIVEYFGNDTFNAVNSSVSNVTISILQSILTIESPLEVLEGSHLFIKVHLHYSNGTPIAGALITCTFSFGGSTSTGTGYTNEFGEAIISAYVPPLTQRVSVTAEYEGETYITDHAASTEVSTITMGTITLRAVISYFPFWGPALAMAIGIPLLIQYGIRRPRKKKLLKQWRASEQKFHDIANVDFFLLMMKESGINVFSHSFKGETLEYELIGSFLTAITMFQGELLKKSESEVIEQDSFELNYKNFKIYVQMHENLMGILISESSPSDELKNACLGFLKEFNSRYEDVLRNFDGRISHFADAGDLIEKYFNTTLIYPHVVKTEHHPAVRRLKGLELAIYKAAKAIMDQNMYFFIP